MIVEISFYGVLKDTFPEPLRYSGEAQTPAELYDELRRDGSLRFSRQALRVAVNDEFVDWTFPLTEQDRVVFMPPMAGG